MTLAIFRTHDDAEALARRCEQRRSPRPAIDTIESRFHALRRARRRSLPPDAFFARAVAHTPSGSTPLKTCARPLLAIAGAAAPFLAQDCAREGALERRGGVRSPPQPSREASQHRRVARARTPQPSPARGKPSPRSAAHEFSQPDGLFIYSRRCSVRSWSRLHPGGHGRSTTPCVTPKLPGQDSSARKLGRIEEGASVLGPTRLERATTSRLVRRAVRAWRGSRRI